MVTPGDIRELTDQIVSRHQPNRIVLFGSYASETPREVSDVDLLLVMSYEGNALRKALEEETVRSCSAVLHSLETIGARQEADYWRSVMHLRGAEMKKVHAAFYAKLRAKFGNAGGASASGGVSGLLHRRRSLLGRSEDTEQRGGIEHS